MFRIAINKLSKWLFSRVLASHRGGPDGTNQSWDLQFRMEMTLVRSSIGYLFCRGLIYRCFEQTLTSCSNASILECSPPTLVSDGTYLSWDLQYRMEMTLVKSLHSFILFGRLKISLLLFCQCSSI
jgi:hypothetical protein